MIECMECGYCYLPTEGAPLQGISPGTAVEDLPVDFTCPSCGAGPDAFSGPVARRPESA